MALHARPAKTISARVIKSSLRLACSLRASCFTRAATARSLPDHNGALSFGFPRHVSQADLKVRLYVHRCESQSRCGATDLLDDQLLVKWRAACLMRST